MRYPSFLSELIGGCVGVSVNHQGKANCVRQVSGENRFGTHLCLVVCFREEFNKLTMVTSAILSLERIVQILVPLALVLELINLTLHLHILGTFQAASPELELNVSEFESE